MRTGVAVDADWLLDPTLDQANNPEWGAHQVGPLAVALPPSFWTDPRGFCIPIGNLDVRYAPYRRPQSGFKSAPDAGHSHWRDVADAVLARIVAHHTVH